MLQDLKQSQFTKRDLFWMWWKEGGIIHLCLLWVAETFLWNTLSWMLLKIKVLHWMDFRLDPDWHLHYQVSSVYCIVDCVLRQDSVICEVFFFKGRTFRWIH